MSAFNGFSVTGQQFLRDLEIHNERDWFNERKEIYQEEIVSPALAFIVELGERLRPTYPDLNFDTRTNGAGSLMRIYRDTRFSKDKTPYKTNVGIVFWLGQGKKMERPGFYFHMSPQEAWIGGGWYMFTKPVLAKFQVAAADDKKGSQLVNLLHALGERGYTLWGDKYKRVPGDFGNDHPRAELIKHKGIFASGERFSPAILASPSLVDTCYDICVDLLPLLGWLNETMMAD